MDFRPVIRLCTFEVSTHLGRHRRAGAIVDGRIIDINFATSWYMAQTGEAEPQRMADALVPSDMVMFLRSGLRALHTMEELFLGSGPQPGDFWKRDGELPRGPRDETLVYRPEEVRLVAPLVRRRFIGPEDEIPAATCRPGVAAVVGSLGLVGFTIANQVDGRTAAGPYIALRADVETVAGLAVVARVNGSEAGRGAAGEIKPAKAAAELIVRAVGIDVAVASGDVIEIEVEKIGVLRNRVR